ncbi:hypothetical protein ES703_95274 [subsurface metagenome]
MDTRVGILRYVIWLFCLVIGSGGYQGKVFVIGFCRNSVLKFKSIRITFLYTGFSNLFNIIFICNIKNVEDLDVGIVKIGYLKEFGNLCLVGVRVVETQSVIICFEVAPVINFKPIDTDAIICAFINDLNGNIILILEPTKENILRRYRPINTMLFSS